MDVCGASLLELRVGEGESLKLCLVERSDSVSIDRSQVGVLRDKVRVKITEVSFGSLKKIDTTPHISLTHRAYMTLYNYIKPKKKND